MNDRPMRVGISISTGHKGIDLFSHLRTKSKLGFIKSAESSPLT